MSVHLFADSFGDGTGASVPEKSYENLLGVEIGTILNHSHGGDMWADQAANVYASTIVIGDISMVELGCNDQRIYLYDTVKRDYYLKGIAALVGWLGCSTKFTAKLFGAETGSWEDTSLYPALSAHGRTALAVGATKTFTVNGYVAYVCYLRKDGQDGAFEVKIDGVSKGVFSTNAPGLTTYNGKTYGPQLLQFKSLGPGQHTVQITQTQAGKAYVEWVAGSSDQVTRPEVRVANITYSGTYQWGGSSANVDAYNTDLQAMVTDLYAQGFRASIVDINAVVDPALDLAGDSLHPNDTGHLKIKNSFFATLGISPATVVVRPDGRVFAHGVELVKV
jgi:hypothetical protein